MAEPTSDILSRLENHITQMAPYQKERRAGKLLIEAADEIKRLRKARTALENTIADLTPDF